MVGTNPIMIGTNSRLYIGDTTPIVVVKHPILVNPNSIMLGTSPIKMRKVIVGTEPIIADCVSDSIVWGTHLIMVATMPVTQAH
jgi:hypothetical protein